MKGRIKIKYILLILLNPLLLFSQNLVSNYSFEQYTVCPDNTEQIKYATPWFQPHPSYGGYGADYFNQCDTDFVSVPYNWFGYQYPRTGFAYTDIAVYSGNYSNYREYLEGVLKDSLIAGQRYCVEFYVSLSDVYPHSIDAIGTYFSKDTVWFYNPNYDKVLPYQPQVENRKGNVITDTANWVLVSGEFIAQGGERFITIGNFQVDSMTTADSPGPGYANYYIDDVSVTLCDSKDSSISTFSLYPSLSNGEITVSSPITEKATLIINNILGQRIATYSLHPGNNSITLPELAAAMYLYQIVVDEVVVKKDKMVVVR